MAHLYTGFILVSLALCVLGAGEDCNIPSDCGSGECCKSHGGLKGKRDGAIGSCHPHGRDGQKCFVENRFASHGVYYTCPCGDGYTCKGSHLVEIPYGETGVCERETKTCAKGSDCADDECCVSLVRPLGKRMAGNVCRKLGDVKGECLVSLGSGKKETTGFLCPCKADLTCTANGRFDMPLGPLGNCA